MRHNTLLIDASIAVALAIVALIILPGLALVAILAAAVLVVCTLSFALGVRPRRRPRGARPGALRPATDRSPRGS